MSIKTIGIVGLGRMGQGIAQVVVQNGFDTLLYDATPDFAAKGIERIEGSLGRLAGARPARPPAAYARANRDCSR